MNTAAADKLRAAAPFLLTKAAIQQRDILPLAWGTALGILDVLQDGEWHRSSEIAVRVGKSPSHIKAILQQVRDAWALDTSNRKGFKLPKHSDTFVAKDTNK